MEKNLLSQKEIAADTVVNETQAFLGTLFGNLKEGVLSVNWFRNGVPKTKWFGIDELHDMAAWAVRIGGKYDTYFCINPRKKALEGFKRGGADDIYAVCSLCADLDIKGPAHAENDLPETEGELLSFIKSLSLQPSITVSSGNGMHLYWVLKDPIMIGTDAPYEAAEALSKAWEQYVKDKAHTEHGWNFNPLHDNPTRCSRGEA